MRIFVQSLLIYSQNKLFGEAQHACSRISYESHVLTGKRDRCFRIFSLSRINFPSLKCRTIQKQRRHMEAIVISRLIHETWKKILHFYRKIFLHIYSWGQRIFIYKHPRMNFIKMILFNYLMFNIVMHKRVNMCSDSYINIKQPHRYLFFPQFHSITKNIEQNFQWDATKFH